MDNQSGKFRVPSEVTLFIMLLTLIIRGQSLLCFPPATSPLSTDMTIKRIWLDILGLKKISQFLTLQYVKISRHSYVIHMLFLCSRMSFECIRKSLVYYWYILVCYPYAICISLVWTCMWLLSGLMSSLCHSYVILPWTK